MPAATSAELVALSSTTVVIHPLVLLSAVDHAERVAKGTSKRVAGILLGQDNGKTINITNSYAIPFEEDERDPRTWYVDHGYIESMNQMFKKVNAREKLVGWYHTGPKLRQSDLEINDVIKRFCPRPVMTIIDVRHRDSGIPTDAYVAVEEIKDDGTATQKTFMHVPSAIEAEEAEEIGVEHLLRDIKDLSTGTLSSRVAAQLSSLRGLHSRLLEIHQYLGKVVNKEIPANHQILYNLQDIFNLLPSLSATEFRPEDAIGPKRPFTVATNDQLLIMYISSLIRSVIALHTLVNNRLENAESSANLEANANKKDEKDNKKDEKNENKDKDNKDKTNNNGEKKENNKEGKADNERGL